MKFKVNFKKIMIAALYLNSQFAYAEETQYLQSGQANIMNTNLAYEKCPLIDEMEYDYTGRTQVKTGRKIEEPACVARNREKTKIRNVANEGLQRANALNSGNSNGLVKPTAPPLPDCGSQTSSNGAYNSAYYSCMSNYNNELKEYNRQLQAYNMAVNESAASAASADAKNQAEYASLKDTTATGSMNEIQQKNSKGKMLYSLAAAAAAGYAVTKYANSAACFSQCGAMGGGCCAMGPGLMAAGVAFMLINGMSNKQSGQHAAAAAGACNAYNQISTDKKDCSSEGQSSTVTISSIDPGTGKCKPDAPAECQQGLDQGGVKIPIIKNANGKSGMTSAELNKMATLLPDGTVKDKNGKIWSMADFADTKAMIAAGMSPADAAKLQGELYGPGGALAKMGINAKDSLKDLSIKPGIDFNMGAGGINIVDVNKTEASQNKLYKENLNDVTEKDRKPSSEGLAKEFNGELIGVSGDDIFMMMNRRYKLKDDQDTFISTEAHK